MPSLPITSILVGLAAILLVLLSVPISLRRQGARIAHGDGGDPDLMRRVRAHGNFIEYAPLGLLAVALVELCGYQPAVVWGVGGGLLAGRALHALGTYARSTPGRAVGVTLTWLALLAAGGLLLFGKLGG